MIHMRHYYYRIGFPIVVSIIICLIGALNTLAGDVPDMGLLYNTKETHSLVFRCQQNSENVLICEFTQTAVRKKAKPEDLKSSLDKARAEFRNGVKFSPEECKTYSQLLEVFEGRKKPPKGEDKINKMSTIEKKDIIESMKAMTKFCKDKTETNYLKLIHLSHEKDMRTCQVSSNTFKQTFRYIQDNVSGVGTWVTKGEPAGPCGLVQLSRFEPEQTKGVPFVFWKYTARKAVTNPQGFIAPGVSCKGLDESEYLYDWRSKEHQLSCDYIEFSVL